MGQAYIALPALQGGCAERGSWQNWLFIPCQSLCGERQLQEAGAPLFAAVNLICVC